MSNSSRIWSPTNLQSLLGQLQSCFSLLCALTQKHTAWRTEACHFKHKFQWPLPKLVSDRRIKFCQFITVDHLALLYKSISVSQLLVLCFDFHCLTVSDHWLDSWKVIELQQNWHWGLVINSSKNPSTVKVKVV